MFRDLANRLSLIFDLRRPGFSLLVLLRLSSRRRQDVSRSLDFENVLRVFFEASDS